MTALCHKTLHRHKNNITYIAFFSLSINTPCECALPLYLQVQTRSRTTYYLINIKISWHYSSHWDMPASSWPIFSFHFLSPGILHFPATPFWNINLDFFSSFFFGKLQEACDLCPKSCTVFNCFWISNTLQTSQMADTLNLVLWHLLIWMWCSCSGLVFPTAPLEVNESCRIKLYDHCWMLTRKMRVIQSLHLWFSKILVRGLYFSAFYLCWW